MRHSSRPPANAPAGKSGNGCRNLLLDCRAALRRHHKQFESDPLRVKIDEALAELDKPVDEDELAEPETRTAQQVAYAWQIAVRTLKLTHPNLYDTMSRRVRDMLDTEVLDDPATEFLKMEARLDAEATSRQNAEKELATLRQALAEAMPLADEDTIGRTAELDHKRIQLLLKAASSGGMAARPSGDGAPAVTTDPFGMEHSRESLLPVIQGRRALTQGERSWCIAEAMVVSEMREVELRSLPDVELVNLVLR